MYQLDRGFQRRERKKERKKERKEDRKKTDANAFDYCQCMIGLCEKKNGLISFLLNKFS